jgi:SAM-dependent methyltransferase
MKALIGKIPIIGPFARWIYHATINPSQPFPGSERYWIRRYDSGGTSGDGSYDKHAEFKAQILNDFVRQKGIATVIEYGCGDGNQLRLANYPSYVGFDVSPKAIEMCKAAFVDDASKTFRLLDQYDNDTAQLTLSLDVIYHLVEDSIFVDHMNRLFDSAERFVVIYASNTDVNLDSQPPHVKHRNFTKWVRQMKPNWRLIEQIPNRFPVGANAKYGSPSDFFIFEQDDVLRSGTQGDARG